MHPDYPPESPFLVLFDRPTSLRNASCRHFAYLANTANFQELYQVDTEYISRLLCSMWILTLLISSKYLRSRAVRAGPLLKLVLQRPVFASEYQGIPGSNVKSEHLWKALGDNSVTPIQRFVIGCAFLPRTDKLTAGCTSLVWHSIYADPRLLTIFMSLPARDILVETLNQLDASALAQLDTVDRQLALLAFSTVRQLCRLDPTTSTAFSALVKSFEEIDISRPILDISRCAYACWKPVSHAAG